MIHLRMRARANFVCMRPQVVVVQVVVLELEVVKVEVEVEVSQRWSTVLLPCMFPSAPQPHVVVAACVCVAMLVPTLPIRSTAPNPFTPPRNTWFRRLR